MSAAQDKISEQRVQVMRREFERAIQDIKSVSALRQLELLIDRQDVDGIMTLLGIDPSAFIGITDSLRSDYQLAGRMAAEVLTPVPVPGIGAVAFRFDMAAPAATTWIATTSSKLVVEIIDDQRTLIREHLSRTTAAGINPRQAAVQLVGAIDRTTGKRTGGIVGLTSQQAGWMSKAEQELINLDSNYFTRKLRDKRFDSTVRKAIADEKPLTKKQISGIMRSLENRTLKYRGDNIARTEAINGLRAGQAESIRQAVVKGELEPQDVTKEWDATGDEDTRPDHEAANGQRQLLQNPFEIRGARMMYPGDSSLGAPGSQTIKCRCRADYRVDFVGRAVRLEGWR